MRLDNVRVVGDNIGADESQAKFVADLLILLVQLQVGGLLGDHSEEGLHPASTRLNHLPIQTRTA